MRPRTRWALAGLGLAAPAAALAGHLGWLGGWLGEPIPRPWQRATGWDRIDPALRPGAPGARFTLGSPAHPEPIELHWLGHSGFLLSWRGTRLLIDPNTRDRCTVSPRLLEPAADPPTLGPIDAVLISHGHYDHLDLPTLAAVPEPGEIVVPAGSEEYVAPRAGAHGPTVAGGVPVVGLTPDLPDRPHQPHRIGALDVFAVPARHNGNRFHPLASRRLAVGYVVRAGETALYFAGDTGAGPHFATIGARFRPQLAVLPIGAFSPPVPIGRLHLSPERAVTAARELGGDAGAPLVVPCHFGTFVLALDRTTTALPRFARAARRAGVDWAMPRLLTPSDRAPGTDADA